MNWWLGELTYQDWRSVGLDRTLPTLLLLSGFSSGIVEGLGRPVAPLASLTMVAGEIEIRGRAIQARGHGRPGLIATACRVVIFSVAMGAVGIRVAWAVARRRGGRMVRRSECMTGAVVHVSCLRLGGSKPGLLRLGVSGSGSGHSHYCGWA